MGLVDNLKAAGFKAEKSTIGDKLIYEGVYKASLFDVKQAEDKGYGTSIYAAFKIQETLAGTNSNSQYPEFKDYFSTAPDKIASKRKGLAKLINGLFSVGVEINTTDDASLLADLEARKGTVVFIKGYKQEPRRKNEATGQWEENPDGDVKQGFTFMTEKNALKEVKKQDAPF